VIWAGVDVGGRRKGFHAAAVDSNALVAAPVQLRTVGAAVGWLLRRKPELVAVDSPVAAARSGARSRDGERELARTVCGIRFTPERALLAGNPYYEWILHGFELYEALNQAGLRAIECFPTASWTRWTGARGHRTRAAWSTAALESAGLEAVPVNLNQDDRDAVGAALTARCYGVGECEAFGEIIVPAPG
jgi:predicted nuclease with RNAse H fold